MEYIVGLVLGLGIPLGATLIGFDRDRAFYPVLTMVTASYYDLFAIGRLAAGAWPGNGGGDGLHCRRNRRI